MKGNTNTLVYWTLVTYEDWHMYIAATDRGLCYVSSEAYDDFARWIKARVQHGTLMQDDQQMQAYKTELIEYFQGKRKQFTLPLDLYGTPFQLAVWNALCDIPFGQTRAYSDIANQIKKPKAVRAVGAAIGANPVLIVVPCHRVIGKNGALTGFRCGMEMKKTLLQIESGI